MALERCAPSGKRGNQRSNGSPHAVGRRNDDESRRWARSILQAGLQTAIRPQAEKLVNDLRRVVRAFVTRRQPLRSGYVEGGGFRPGLPPESGALDQLMPSPPGDSAPVLIVQHMPSTFTPLLASMLNRRSALRVTEARICSR